MKVKLLIIDDHPLIIEGYQSVLRSGESIYDVDILGLNNAEEARQTILNAAPDTFDMVFIDRCMQNSSGHVSQGESIGRLIMSKFPNWKVVFITSHTETFAIYEIIKNIDPAGIILKSDLNPADFRKAFSEIAQGKRFYSETVQRNLKIILSKHIFLDNYNRQIISLLAQGVQSKNLTSYIPLSTSAIDKRKSFIKEYLEIEKGTDEDIIRQSRELGFI